jgi:uncharacterized NAD(P)/FAD-binding protein YdhS
VAVSRGPDDRDRPVIAIIGGGASGALVAVHLLREAVATDQPVAIALIDRDARHGLGRAYSTTHPGHLLNSPAWSMSAVDGDEHHLTRWACQAGIRHDGFLSRADYGRYLLDLLAQAQHEAGPASRVCQVTADITGLTVGTGSLPVRLCPAGGGRIDADAAVLATGLLPPATICPDPPAARYVADPWAPGALAAIADGRPVVVAGTGLTMLDVAMSVTDAHPATVVHAVSRHGLLPREHRPAADPGGSWRPALAPAALAPPWPVAAAPVRLDRLVRYVRAAAADRPGDWQSVVDGLRPHVPGLWQQLSPADQRLFLRRYARYWEVHRHRVPPATARKMAALRAAGRLVVHRGRVAGAELAGPELAGTGLAGTGLAGSGDLRVRISDNGTVTELSAGWLVNGTGPAADITAAADPLLRALLSVGLVRPDPLGLGLDADPGGALLDAAGRPSPRLFTLGPVLRGRRYETTAIPEIRGQAAALARGLIRSAAGRAAADSAA